MPLRVGANCYLGSEPSVLLSFMRLSSSNLPTRYAALDSTLWPVLSPLSASVRDVYRDEAFGPVRLGLPFALGRYLLKYSQPRFKATLAEFPQPRALKTGTSIGDEDMVVGEQTLLPGTVLSAANPGGVLSESFVGFIGPADILDLRRDRADKGVDIGVVREGRSFRDHAYASPMLPHVTLVSLVRMRSSNTTSSESCTSGSSQ